MHTYALNSLLRLRERIKASADNLLKEAVKQHLCEQQKFVAIETSLRNTVSLRARMHDSFFEKAKVKSFNKREVISHASLGERHLFNEDNLRKELSSQECKVESAKRQVEAATAQCQSAYKNLKVVERHYAAWQKQKSRQEDLKVDYESDDLNNIRFILKKA